MLGAIAGDIIGSVYEAAPMKSEDFPLFVRGCCFTDDTVLSVAIADAILSGAPYADKLREYYRYYSHAGYGGLFTSWARSPDRGPYNSWGNGSAMRVGPVGFAFDSLDETLDEARRTAEVTHNHPEGIKGAQAVAAAVFLARSGAGKPRIKEYVESRFRYDLSESVETIREYYSFDVSCAGSVPQALSAFLESNDFEDAIRKAVSLGGDSDTQACIAGAVAETHYGGVPEHIEQRVREILDDRLNEVVTKFRLRFVL